VPQRLDPQLVARLSVAQKSPPKHFGWTSLQPIENRYFDAFTSEGMVATINLNAVSLTGQCAWNTATIESLALECKSPKLVAVSEWPCSLCVLNHAGHRGNPLRKKQ